MTGPRWIEQIVLGDVLEGVEIAAADPMVCPLVTLRPGARIVTQRPWLQLDPAEGGVIVRDRSQGAAADPVADPAAIRLAIAASQAAARALAARVWERDADLLFDGHELVAAARGGDLVADFEAGLAAARAAEPTGMLRRAASVGRTDVLETGEPVVWIDPVQALRGLSQAEAVLAAQANGGVRGRARLLAIPAGSVRLRFDPSGVDPGFAPAQGCTVRRIAADVFDVEAAAPAGFQLLEVTLHRAALTAVGLILGVDRPKVTTEPEDPLAVYADPFHLDGLA